MAAQPVGTTGTLSVPLHNTPAGCAVAANALRSFSSTEAKRELQSIMTKGAWTTAASLGFLVVWVVLMVVRYRVLRKRIWRLVCDFVCALLAAVATTLFIVGSMTLNSGKTTSFWRRTHEHLKTANFQQAPHYMDQLPYEFLQISNCRTDRESMQLAGIYNDDKALKVLQEHAALIRDAQKPSLLFIAASTLAAVAAIFLLASIISFILAACVKTVPQDTNGMRGPHSAVYTATDIRGRSLRTRMLSRGGRGNRRGMGLVLGDFGRGGNDATINDMPATEAIEFFSRFIQKVPPPQDGVVLGGGVNGTDCRICLEVLLEDIGRLTACNHDFHRRCILQWLLRSDDPSCPLCKKPVRLCSAPYTPTVSTQDNNNHSEHSHNDHGHGHCNHTERNNNNDGDVNINMSDYNTDTDLDAEGLVNVDLQSQDSSIIPPAPISNPRRL